MTSCSGTDEDRSSPAPELPRHGPPSDLALSIEQDFRALVEVLSNPPKGFDALDQELLDHLRRARDAAARGLRLSQRLVRMAEFADSPKSGAQWEAGAE